MNHKDQKKSEDTFNEDPLRCREINCQLRSAGYDHIPSEQTEAD